MSYRAVEPVTSNGVIIDRGQAVEDLSEEAAKRLLDLGVIEKGAPIEVAADAAAAPAEEHKTTLGERLKNAVTGTPSADQVAADAAAADGRGAQEGQQA